MFIILYYYNQLVCKQHQKSLLAANVLLMLYIIACGGFQELTTLFV